jgi:hypothetical protein
LFLPSWIVALQIFILRININKPLSCTLYLFNFNFIGFQHNYNILKIVI